MVFGCARRPLTQFTDENDVVPVKIKTRCDFFLPYACSVVLIFGGSLAYAIGTERDNPIILYPANAIMSSGFLSLASVMILDGLDIYFTHALRRSGKINF
jgi:hypothetical protein